MSIFKDRLTAANTTEEINANKNDKIPEIVAAFEKCYDLDPSNEETKRKYLSYYKRQLELEHFKKNQEELKVLGNAQIQQGRNEEAVIIFNASIDLDPSIESAAPIYSNRSLAFFNLGRFKEAEDDACMAIFLRPEFARGYLRRGNAAMKLEKWKESLEAYEKYFELDLENAKKDPDLVKNKNCAKKNVEHAEAEIRKHGRLIEKTRAELMAIKDEKERNKKALKFFFERLDYRTSFDVDLVRVLVECGAHLTPFEAEQQQKTVTSSCLGCLLYIRLQVSPKILPQFDELLFFIIDEMSRRNASFIGWELSKACDTLACGPVNAKLVRVLLETSKFDVNRGFGEHGSTPLVSLVGGMVRCVEVPPAALDCLHLLLNWKGVEVNARSTIKNGDLVEVTALDVVRHPEVAKVLIRYGADVNAITSWCGESSNVLDHVLSSSYYPEMEELVRLLIGSGARLLPNGRNGKSSKTMMRIWCGGEDPATRKKTFVSEEVLQIILQLNLHQGLLFRFRSATSAEEMPFLFGAIELGAPFRFVELLRANNPAAMKETGMNRDGKVVTVADALKARIGRNASSFEESMQILDLLLEHGLDLFERNSNDGGKTTFALIWNACLEEKLDLKLLEITIIGKREEEEFERCKKTLK